VRRGTELAKEQGIDNVHFQVICRCLLLTAAGVMLRTASCAQCVDTM
jgi:hypothetical protein